MLEELLTVGIVGGIGYALYRALNGDSLQNVVGIAPSQTATSMQTTVVRPDTGNGVTFDTGTPPVDDTATPLILPPIPQPPPVIAPSPATAPAWAFSNDPLTTLLPEDLFARMIWGESRGSSDAAMQAVANVAMNRLHDPQGRWPHDLKSVLLQQNQFTSLTPNDPNYPKILAINTTTDKWYAKALSIALAAMQGTLPDNTGGAQFDHNIGFVPSGSFWSGLQHTVDVPPFSFYRLTPSTS